MMSSVAAKCVWLARIIQGKRGEPRRSARSPKRKRSKRSEATVSVSMGWLDEIGWYDFEKYLVYYPEEDQPGFDGIHHGGIKGIREDAPESAKAKFAKYQKRIASLERKGICL